MLCVVSGRILYFFPSPLEILFGWMVGFWFEVCLFVFGFFLPPHCSPHSLDLCLSSVWCYKAEPSFSRWRGLIRRELGTYVLRDKQNQMNQVGWETTGGTSASEKSIWGRTLSWFWLGGDSSTWSQITCVIPVSYGGGVLFSQCSFLGSQIHRQGVRVYGQGLCLYIKEVFLKL